MGGSKEVNGQMLPSGAEVPVRPTARCFAPQRRGTWYATLRSRFGLSSKTGRQALDCCIIGKRDCPHKVSQMRAERGSARGTGWCMGRGSWWVLSFVRSLKRIF